MIMLGSDGNALATRRSQGAKARYGASYRKAAILGYGPPALGRRKRSGSGLRKLIVPVGGKIDLAVNGPASNPL